MFVRSARFRTKAIIHHSFDMKYKSCSSFNVTGFESIKLLISGFWKSDRKMIVRSAILTIQGFLGKALIQNSYINIDFV